MVADERAVRQVGWTYPCLTAEHRLVDGVRDEGRAGSSCGVGSVDEIGRRPDHRIRVHDEVGLESGVVPLATERRVTPVVDDVEHDPPARSPQARQRRLISGVGDLDNDKSAAVDAPLGEQIRVEAGETDLFEARMDVAETEVHVLVGRVAVDVGHVIPPPYELQGDLGASAASTDIVERHGGEDHHCLTGDGIPTLRINGGGDGRNQADTVAGVGDSGEESRQRVRAARQAANFVDDRLARHDGGWLHEQTGGPVGPARRLDPAGDRGVDTRAAEETCSVVDVGIFGNHRHLAGHQAKGGRVDRAASVAGGEQPPAGVAPVGEDFDVDFSGGACLPQSEACPEQLAAQPIVRHHRVGHVRQQRPLHRHERFPHWLAHDGMCPSSSGRWR